MKAGGETARPVRAVAPGAAGGVRAVLVVGGPEAGLIRQGNPRATPGAETALAHQRLAAADLQGPVAGPSLDEPVLILVPQRFHLLFQDRIVDYWLYPRKGLLGHRPGAAGGGCPAVRREEGDPLALRRQRAATPGASPDASRRAARAMRARCGPSAPRRRRRSRRPRPFPGRRNLHPERPGRGPPPRLSRLERVAASYLIGAGATGLWTLTLFAAGLRVQLSTVLLSLIAGLVALLHGRRRSRESTLRRSLGRKPRASVRVRRTGSRRSPRRRSWESWSSGAVALPMSAYDDRYQWAHKAQIMLNEDGIRSSAFQDPQSLQVHPKYPLLIPSIEAVVFLYAGGFDDQYAPVLFPLFLGALLLIFYQGLLSLRGPRGAGPLTLALALIPCYWGYGSDGAFAGFPDLPLSVFLASAIIYLLRGRASGSPSPPGTIGPPAPVRGAHQGRGQGPRADLPARGERLSALDVPTRGMSSPQLQGVGPVSGRRAADRGPRDSSSFARHRPASCSTTTPPCSPGTGSSPTAAVSPRSRRCSRRTSSCRRGSGSSDSCWRGRCCLWRRRVSAEALMPTAYVVLMAFVFGVPFVLLPETLWQGVYFWSAGRLLVQILPVGFLALCLQALPRDGRALPTVAPAPQGG